MRTSIQKARDYREKQNREQELPPLPEKPEDMRYGIIFLYAACCVSLMFLIITGDVHWVEASAAGNGIMQTVLVHMGIAALLEGLLAFALSRCLAWPLWGVLVLTAVNIGFLAYGALNLLEHSQGLFVCRTLAVLMDCAAIFFLTGTPSRECFALLRSR